jgi:hypothetical protein
MPFPTLGFTDLVAAITAIGALGTAAFALVDASKAFGGGASNFGNKILRTALARFEPALERALPGGEWWIAVRAHWINGRPRDQQKAIVRSLIRLGLTGETARALAGVANVAPAALAAAADRVAAGAALEPPDFEVLGRLDASIEAYLDAAFDLAEQRYRNVSRVLAGAAAVVLSLAAAWALEFRYGTAILVGLLAVPFAPIAKDLASSLQAAAQALRSTRP